jgi:3-methyladenine DNA glycosylase AlkC
MNRLVSLNTALKQLNSKSGSALLLHQPLASSAARRPALAALSTLTKPYEQEMTPSHVAMIQRKSFHIATALRSTQSAATEKVVGTPEKFEFLAETKQLLNIVAKSLYSDKEVFVRELISNASDAIEKLKYAQLSSDQSASSAEANQVPYEIKIDANDLNNTLTIQV